MNILVAIVVFCILFEVVIFTLIKKVTSIGFKIASILVKAIFIVTVGYIIYEKIMGA